jgi:Uma2 family endonuclease
MTGLSIESPLTQFLQIPASFQVTPAQFEQLAIANRETKLERTANGELIIMSPTGGLSGKRNADLVTDLSLWNRQAKLGVVFDSSTEFRLPNGAYRSPDVAWISNLRWNALTLTEQETFPPLCPDFVIELRSKTDALNKLRDKMQDYRNNGCRLGWLLNVQDQQVEIYRSDQSTQILQSPSTLSGEEVLPGFVLDVTLIF